MQPAAGPSAGVLPVVADAPIASTAVPVSLGAATETRVAVGLLLIPAYNEEASIGPLLENVLRYWPRERVLVVNDGSRDGTAGVVDVHGVRQIVLPANLGYGGALQTGFLYAERCGYDFIVLLDADGQHDPRYLPEMTRVLLETGADLVVGSRFVDGGREGVPLVRRLGMTVFAALTRLCTGFPSTDTSSGFKAISARLFRELHAIQSVDFHAELYMYVRMRGYSVVEHPVRMHARIAGFSMYTWPKLLLYPAKTLLGMAVAALDAAARGRRERAGRR